MKNLITLNSKRTKQRAFAILIALLMTLSFIANVGAVVVDLTPDYAKPGDTIDILSWDIVGPIGNTSLTWISVGYSGTNATSDMEYIQFYANNTLLGTVYQLGGWTLSPSYLIEENDTVTITMKIKIADTGVHGNHVDGYIVNYVLSHPGDPGTDGPADPAGYTIIDNHKPVVVSATAVPDPAKDGTVTVTVVFNETMDTTVSPSVNVTNLKKDPYNVTQFSYSGNTWIGKFTLLDQNEEDTATIAVGFGQDVAGNVMVTNSSAGTFEVDTIDPTVDIAVSDTVINEDDAGNAFNVTATFSEAMDTGVTPIFDFNPSVSTTLTSPSDAWSLGNTTYTITYIIADVNVEVNDVNVTISGGEDPAGNIHAPYKETNMFDVDTIKPEVLWATATPDPAKNGTVTVTVKFSEAMDTSVSPTVNVTGLASSNYTLSKISYTGDTWIGNFTLLDDDEDTEATITVSGGKDIRGNMMLADYCVGTFDVDTIDPSVLGIWLSHMLINEDENGNTFDVTVTFSEAMNIGVTPIISFNQFVSTTLTLPSDAWSLGNTTYTITYIIADVNVEVYDVNVTVSGGKDPAGNPHAPFTEYIYTFDIDTIAPTVDEIAVSDKLINEDDDGDFFYVYVNFSEPMAMIAPAIWFNPSFTQTLSFNGGVWDPGDTRYTAKYAITDDNVEQSAIGVFTIATDTAGNGVFLAVADLFDIDTIAPTVTISVSDDEITEADVGGSFYVNATYSESMNTTFTPDVGFTPDVNAGTLVFNSGAWSLSNTKYTANYTVVDVNEETAYVNVTVGGAKDLAWNDQVPDPANATALFYVDTAAPDITSISWSIDGMPVTIPESNITVTLIGDENCTATFDIVNVNSSVLADDMPMVQGPLGTYTGNYTVKYGDDGTYLIDGYLVDDAGNVASIIGTTPTDEPPFMFRVGGTGTAEWSSEEEHSGEWSVKLETIVGPTDRAEIRMFPEGLKLDDLNSLSYWSFTESKDIGSQVDVFVDIWLDFDGTGELTPGNYPGYLQAERLYTYGEGPIGEWFFTDAMSMKWSTYVGPDDPYNAPTIYDLQANIDVDDWTGGVDFGELDVLVLDVRVGYGGTWDNFTGYADDVKINNVIYNMELPFKIDTVPPSVVSVTVSDPWITEADDGDLFNVTVTYSEDMNTTIAPSIVFDPDVSTTLIAPMSGAWVSSTVYKYTYTVEDDDVEEGGVDVNVTGAEDLAGKLQVNHTAPNKFKVDTLAPPAPTGLDAPEYINIANETAFPVSGSAEDNTTVRIRLSDGVTQVINDFVHLSGSFSFSQDVSGLKDGNITIDANATDEAGNTGPSSSNITRTKDTKRPIVITADADPDPTKEGTVTVTVVFNETMKTSVSPTVNVTGLSSSYTVNQDTYSDDTWNGTFILHDDNEEEEATIEVSLGKDLADNPMLANTNAGAFEVDTKGPTVDISVSDDWISEADDGDLFNVTVTYSEDMNTTIAPSIVFDPDVSTTLKAPEFGAWVSSTVYKYTYTIYDANVTATGIDVNVTGAKDEIGNSQEPDPTTEAKMFDIDTQEPTVVSIWVSDDLINEEDDGGYFWVNVTFSETMNTTVIPDISFTPDVNASGTLTFYDDGWSLGDTRYTANYTVTDVDEEQVGVNVSVSGAKDLAGNEDPLTEPDMFDVDTIAPTVDDIFVSDDYIKEDDIPGKFHVYVNFSEAMNTSKIPSILFEPGVSSTLENQTGAWSIDETDYTFTYDIADANVMAYDVNVTVNGAEDAAGNPDPLKEEDLFDIDTYHHIGEPEYIDMWAEYRPPMSIILNANEVAWPMEGWYSEWNSPEYALESDDEYAFLTYANATSFEVGMVLFFEDLPQALDVYEITSVKLHVEQKLISDLFAVTEDRWLFEIGSELDEPIDYKEGLERVGTVTENELSIDITDAINESYALDWEYIAEIAVAVYPEYSLTPMGEWYIDNVWIEVNCVYEDEGTDITIPVDGEAAIYAYVTDAFGDPVPETEVSFETNPIGTVDPESDTTDGGKAETTLTSKEVGTATVTATAGEVEGNCNVTFLARTLEIELSQGWNLISVPRELENSAIETVFDGTTPIEKVYTYRDGNWSVAFYNGTAWINPISEHPIDDIDDGKGYWVYASEQTTVTISLKPLGFTGAPPPDYTLSGGWNMIGYTSMQLEPETPVNVYLTSLDGKWISLYRSTPEGGLEISKPSGLGFKNFELGIGYWIYLNALGALVP